MQAMVRVVKAQRKPFTDASLKTMFATCRKLVPKLKGWKLLVKNMRVNAGQTWYLKKQIQVARRMLHVYSTKEVVDVLLHEIAHALLPSRCGHGLRWMRMHKSFGGTGHVFCRVFHKPQQAYGCKCNARIAYAPSKKKWCLQCESLERPIRVRPRYRICSGVGRA